MKIQDGGGRHLGYENVNNSELDRAICAKFGGQMHHGHVEMTHDQKLKPEVNSNERLEHKCVDLSDYRRYLNQILCRAQAPHY